MEEAFDQPVPIPTAQERAWVRRVLWIGWGVSAALGVAALVLRALTHIRRIELIPIGLAVLAMVAVHLIVRKKTQVSLISASMSISGIVTGACLGFMAMDVAAPRNLGLLLSLKWLAAAVFLNLLFLKELHREEKWSLEAEAEARRWEEEQIRIERMTPEEREAHFEAWAKTMDSEMAAMEELMQRLQKKQTRYLVLAGFAVVASVVFWVVSGRL